MNEKHTEEDGDFADRSWPLPGDPGVVSVVPKAGCGIQLLRIALAAAPLVLCCGGMGAGVSYLFERSFGDPEGALGTLLSVLSMVIPLGVTALMAWVFVVPIRAPYKHTLLIVSPVGVEMQDNHLGVDTRLRWEDIIGCTTASAPKHAPCAASPAQATIDTDPRLAMHGYGIPMNYGIVGWAEQSFPDPIPGPWEEITRVQKVDPNSGKRQAVIPFSLFGISGPNNPLIRYLKHHCPRLFEGPALDGDPNVHQGSEPTTSGDQAVESAAGLNPSGRPVGPTAPEPTPPPPAPALSPSAPPGVSDAQIEAWREQGTKALGFGALWIVAGLVITGVTYSNAVSSEFGGLYVIAWGPVVYGVIRVIYGCVLHARARS